MTVTEIERNGDKPIFKDNISGAMPVNTESRPREARAGFKLLSVRKVLFLMGMPFPK